MPRSAVFSMRIPGGWLDRSCDSWHVQFFPFVLGSVGHFLRFLRCFLLCKQFVTVVGDFTIFVAVFSVRFFKGFVHMPRNTVNSISASLDSSGPASSPSDGFALSTTSTSTSSSSFTLSPSSVAISAETLSQAISQAL